MKSIILIFFCSLFSMNGFGQSNEEKSETEEDKDTSAQIVQINKITPRKKGIYKTYDEYLNNSPSLPGDFKLTPVPIKKNNPLVAEAVVEFIGKRPKKIWGVSDGENVYIKVISGQFFESHYFKLQCDGPQPYIFLVEKAVIVPMGLGLIAAVGVAATSASLPPFVSLFYIKDETNYRKPILLATSARVKRFLATYPDLLEAYDNEPNHNRATRAKYLTEYNKRKMMK